MQVSSDAPPAEKPDRRAVEVTLTDLGRRQLHDLLERAVPYLDQIRSAVTPPDTASVSAPDGAPGTAAGG